VIDPNKRRPVFRRVERLFLSLSLTEIGAHWLQWETIQETNATFNSTDCAKPALFSWLNRLYTL